MVGTGLKLVLSTYNALLNAYAQEDDTHSASLCSREW